MPIIIELPGEPIGKGRPRFRRAGSFMRAYTPAKTADYERGLKWMAKIAMKGRAPLDGPLAVSVLAAMTVPASWSQKKRAAALAGQIRPTSKPDIDNILKSILDALNGVAWIDDKQVVDVRIIKAYSERPQLRIEIVESLRP